MNEKYIFLTSAKFVTAQVRNPKFGSSMLLLVDEWIFVISMGSHACTLPGPSFLVTARQNLMIHHASFRKGAFSLYALHIDSFQYPPKPSAYFYGSGSASQPHLHIHPQPLLHQCSEMPIKITGLLYWIQNLDSHPACMMLAWGMLRTRKSECIKSGRSRY